MAKRMDLQLNYAITALVAVLVIISGVSRAYSPSVVLVLFLGFLAPKLPTETIFWIAGWALVALAITAVVEDDGKLFEIAADIHEAAYYVIAICVAALMSQKCTSIKEASLYIVFSFFASILFGGKTKSNIIAKNVMQSITAALCTYFVFLHSDVGLTIKI